MDEETEVEPTLTMDWSALETVLQNPESLDQETSARILANRVFWDDGDPELTRDSTSQFMQQNGHEMLKKLLLSGNIGLQDLSLSCLDFILVTDPNRELRVYYATDAAVVDTLVRFAGKEGQQKSIALADFESWTLQMLSLEIIDSLAEAYEARALFVPRIPELLDSVSSESSLLSRFSLYMAIAKLVGNSDRPQDLDIVNRKDVIEDILYAFVNGCNRHLEDDGRSLLHTAPAIRALANNENLRKTLVECGVVPAVVAKLDSEEVQLLQANLENVVGIIVNLSFDKEIADSFRQADVIDKLKTLQQSNKCTGPGKVQVEQALWLLELKAQQVEKEAESVASKKDAKHVMISYCWAQQPLILKLNEFLKSRGIKVWIDVEQMAGSTLEAMAGAVENSSVVLICLSQRYKESSNCQIEGEYVFSSKKPFLPILVEPNYKASGWLGALLGSKLYYDVSKDDRFTSGAEMLLEEIVRLTDVCVKATPIPPCGVAPSKPSAADWKQEEVGEWLKKIGLEQYDAKFEQEAINGRALRGLSLLPPSDLLQLTSTFGIEKLGHKLVLLESLDTLFK